VESWKSWTREVTLPMISAESGRERTFLTLGEGDFSWSADLAVFLAASSTTKVWASNRLVATALDSLDDLRRKYTDYDSIVKKILRMDSAHFRVQVKHEINAIDCFSSQNIKVEDMKADVVIFNHPHLGTEDAALHGRFLHHLFDTVRTTWIKEHGVFIVTLAVGQYERWKCEEAAKKSKFRLLEKRRFIPNASADSVYELRRHQTGKSFRMRTSGSYSFIYAQLDSDDDESPIEKIEDLPWFQKVGVDEKNSHSVTPSTQGIPFTCIYCGRTFREERSVKDHIDSKHGSTNKRKLQCMRCKETRIFDSQEALRDHELAKHRGLYETVQPDWVYTSKDEPSTTLGRCAVCGIAFAATFGLKEHMGSFLPQTPRIFPCQFCFKTFHSMRARKQHENFCSASQPREVVKANPSVD
jgi:Domain of unknown function (DUF2431)